LTASADKVLRVDGTRALPRQYRAPTPTITPGWPGPLWYRQVALDYRHNLPVLTVLVLLCKEANSPSLTGTYERQLPDGWPTNRYNYRVVRLWQEDPDPYLAGGVNLVPLAPLTNVGGGDAARPGAADGRADQPRARRRGRKKALDSRVVPHGAALRAKVRHAV